MADRTEAEDAYYAGRKAYSLQSPRGLFSSRDLFRQAIKLDPKLAKAHSLLAYTLVQAWLQGWSGDGALAEAHDEAEQGVTLAPNDPYTNAELGFYLLNTGNFEAAVNRYETAANAQDASNEVKADCAEAEIYAGNLQDGFDRIKGVVDSNPQPEDWHRWNLAWAWFLRGREEEGLNGDREALDELNRMKTSPRDPAYLIDCLLLRAVVQTRLDLGAEAASDLEWFLGRRTDWTVWREQRSVKFQRSADERHWLDGCRAAKLPE